MNSLKISINLLDIFIPIKSTEELYASQQIFAWLVGVRSLLILLETLKE